MQRMPVRNDAPRPRPLQNSRSFTLPQESPLPIPPEKNAFPHSPLTVESPEPVDDKSHSDIFESHEDESPEKSYESVHPQPETLDGADDLPIEIQSLTERFLESLSLKSRPAPLSVDQVADLYQNFYIHVESQIATHITALSTRISRENSPAPSSSSARSNSSRKPARGNSKTQDPGEAASAETQLLTASEVTDRRKTRRQLELKKLALEEAVEREVCEKVYPRLWKHKSTDDGERDEKLRSRAAALSVVGIDLRELLSTAMSNDGGPEVSNIRRTSNAEQATARNQLSAARTSLERMNEACYPRGKLQELLAAHKTMVETLAQMFPSSSSADEILPTLIYVIISSSPESIHVISNLSFIQRFRAASRMDGEAAYCMTNLEAAISFLETVDLSTIRSGEFPEGPPRHQPSPSPLKETSQDPLYRGLPNVSPDPQKDRLSPPSSPQHTRSLSNLLGARPKPLGAASDAVIHGADSAFDTLHNALDGSFKFLFGRLKEKQVAQSPDGGDDVSVPKTLEDARKLVNSPSMQSDEFKDDTSIGGDSTSDKGEKGQKPDQNSRVLELVGGRRNVSNPVPQQPSREHSVDSVRSGGSGQKKMASTDGASPSHAKGLEGKPSEGDGASQHSATDNSSSQNSGFGAVESMRTFGNSINPLKGFSMRNFGRTASGTSSPASAGPTPVNGNALQISSTEPSSHAPAATATSSAVDLSGIGPPIPRFLDIKEPRELNGYDTELLLRDYQRLAGALKAATSAQQQSNSN